MEANEKPQKPSFVGRLYSGSRYAPSQFDVFWHGRQTSLLGPMIEVGIRRDGKTVVTFLTLEDSEDLVGLLSDAISAARKSAE